MKKLLLGSVLMLCVLACSLFTPLPTPSAADIEKEEQVIYSFFVGANEGTVLILRETETNISPVEPKDITDNILSGFKNISRETVDSYLERNAETSQLSPDMELGVEYTLLTPEELSQITSQPNWHEILNEKYPGSSGYTIFSRVGFNNTLDQAVVYVGQVEGPLMGAGFYNLLEKRNGEWKLMDQIMAWIS